MSVNIQSLVEQCNKLNKPNLLKFLKKEILEHSDYLNLLHEAHGNSNESKTFEYDGKTLEYSHIAEQIFYIEAAKQVLSELYVFGRKHMDFADTVYDLEANFDIKMKKYI